MVVPMAVEQWCSAHVEKQPKQEAEGTPLPAQRRHKHPSLQQRSSSHKQPPVLMLRQ